MQSSAINRKLSTPKNLNLKENCLFLRSRISLNAYEIRKYLDNYFGFGSEEAKNTSKHYKLLEIRVILLKMHNKG